MKRESIRLMAILLLLGAWAPSMQGASLQTEPGFEFLGQEFEGDFLTMDYRLPFGGMVELRIFSKEGKLVWQNQYINRRGENQIRLKADAFETGSVYTIQLNYKEDEYRLNVERK